MWNSIAVMAALLLSGTAHADLKVAAFNIEHLAEADGAGCRPRTEADYAALREYVRALDADVIAFQEVESAAAAARVFPPEAYDVVISSQPWESTETPCRDNPQQTLQPQRPGFAIRKGIAFTHLPDATELAAGSTRLRWGVDVEIASPMRLRLLSVHLKSGCASGDSADACPALRSQFPGLEAWIDARASEGVPFIVAGDFNRRFAITGDPLWAEIDDGSPKGADLLLASEERKAGCDDRFPEFIDNIVLGELAAANLVPSSFEERTYDGPRLSDHCAVSIRLNP